jgi:multiple sugar transport system substrate-binding protein
MPFAWGNGGDVFDANWNVTVNSPQVLDALEFYLKLAPYSLQEKAGSARPVLQTGKLGMHNIGAWNVKNYKVEAPHAEIQLCPDAQARRRSRRTRGIAGAEMLVVFKGSAQRDVAVKLARFLQSYRQARAVSLAAGSVFPASKKPLNDTTFTSDPHIKVFVEQSLTSRTPPAQPGLDRDGRCHGSRGGGSHVRAARAALVSR